LIALAGRKSLADKLLEGLTGPDPHDRSYLLLYDFRGTRAGTRFYTNLQRIMEKAGDSASLVQLSAFTTTSLKAAIAAQALASGMDAETAVYEARERTADELRARLKEAQSEEP
jgi:hypothetical protein